MKKKKIIRDDYKLTPTIEFRRREYKSPVSGYDLIDTRCMVCRLDRYLQCSPFFSEWCSLVNKRKFKIFIYVV